MPSGTEYCQECSVGQSIVSDAQWNRVLSTMPSGTEYCQQCPVGQSTVSNAQWDGLLSAMPNGTEYRQDCSVGQSTVSNSHWDRILSAMLSESECCFQSSQDSLCQELLIARKSVYLFRIEIALHLQKLDWENLVSYFLWRVKITPPTCQVRQYS